MKRAGKWLVMVLLAVLAGAASAASLLPQGQTQFTDANGAPLAGGKVFFYIPSTTTFKTTWQDPGQTVPNTNPVILNGAGRAVIYGSGSYTEVVQDVNGVLQWSALTTDATTAANGTFWGGQSSGSPNAQVIAATGFSTADGQQVAFLAGFSNTGALTITPNSAVGPIPVVVDTSSGPLPLSGGEVAGGDVIQATYTAIGGHFHLTASGGGGGGGGGSVPVGTALDYHGISVPTGFLLEYGQCVSQVTYSNLFAVLGTTYNSGCGAGAFGVPDSRGRVLAGVDNMGGVAAGRLTSATMTPNGITVGATGGTENLVLTRNQLPAVAIPGTVTVNFPGVSYVEPQLQSSQTFALGGVTPVPVYTLITGTTSVDGPTTFNISSSNLGSGAAVPLVVPTLLVNRIIKY